MDTINLIRTYQTYNFIKNLKARISNIENVKANNEYFKAIENTFSNEEILNDIAVTLLNFIWPTSQENTKNITLKRFIKHVMKLSNTTISIFISAIYYLLNLKDNAKFNNLLQRIQLEIENTKQEQGFINDGNIHERCCNCCGAYISCYRNDTVVCKCRLFLVSLVLACKYGQDKNYSNRAWSKISGFSVENINYNERFFLNITEYRLYINIESYQNFATLISNHVINMRNQKQKLHCKELLNLSKINTFDINNIREWKKNMEKKSLLMKKIKQLALKQAELRYQTIQNSSSKPSLVPNNINGQTTIQDRSKVNIQKLLNNARKSVLGNVQKQSPLDNQYSNIVNGVNVNINRTINTINRNGNRPINVAAISPMSPSGIPIANINNNVNINNNINIHGNNADHGNNVMLNENINMGVKKNYMLGQQQNVIVPMLNYAQLPLSVQNVKKGSSKIEKESHISLDNFKSFIKFYRCINEKLSTSNETIIQATSSYKALDMSLKLAFAERVQDALKLLNHVIYGTMDICKEILSLAIKGQKKNALIYIYLLTPTEIQFYNNNLKDNSSKSLTPQDVLSIVSNLLNCVQKSPNNTHEIKNNLLANLGQQSQVNNSSQNLLLKFIQNINNSLSSN